MVGRVVLAAFRLGFALLTFAAIGVQLARQIDRGTSVVNLLSFFTILSNLLAAAILFYLGATPLHERTRRLDLLRGAAVVYMATTGVVFAVLLSDVAVDLTLPWVDTVLHRVMPIVLVVDWLVDPPSATIVRREAAWWLAFPVGWTVYTLVRGAVVDWYPYPFLDPRKHDVLGVAGYVVAIAVFIAVVAEIVRWIGNARSAGMRPVRA